MTKKRDFNRTKNCLTANVIPNGLKLELEPSIGNHNEDFLPKWNDKLNKFSRELTTDVIEFCGKAITETEDTNKEPKGQTNQEQHNEITATLNGNQHTRKKQYKKNKDKKYYNLKYNIRNKPHIAITKTNRTITSTNKVTTVTNRAITKTNRTITSTNKVTTVTNRAITKTNRTITSTNKVTTITNRTITSTNKVTTVTNRAITKTNDPMLLLPVEI